MVQTVKSWSLHPGQQMILVEKPHALRRIFIKILALLPLTSNYRSKISFDDPEFNSFYVLDESARYFEAKGEDICQGDIWVLNVSNMNLLHTATEILH